MTDRGKPKAGFPRSLENAGAFPTFPPHDDYDSPSTKGTTLRRYNRENRFYLTQADHLGHNRFTGVASLRARYRHRPESLSTSRRNALSTSPEYAHEDPGPRVPRRRVARLGRRLHPATCRTHPRSLGCPEPVAPTAAHVKYGVGLTLTVQVHGIEKPAKILAD